MKILYRCAGPSAPPKWLSMFAERTVSSGASIVVVAKSDFRTVKRALPGRRFEEPLGCERWRIVVSGRLPDASAGVHVRLSLLLLPLMEAVEAVSPSSEASMIFFVSSQLLLPIEPDSRSKGRPVTASEVLNFAGGRLCVLLLAKSEAFSAKSENM